MAQRWQPTCCAAGFCACSRETASGHGDHVRGVPANYACPWPTNLLPGGTHGPVRRGRASPPPGSTITLDNKVVVDHGSYNPYREASDMDLCEMAACIIHRKSINVRQILGDRQLCDACNTQQHTNIVQQ